MATIRATVAEQQQKIIDLVSEDISIEVDIFLHETLKEVRATLEANEKKMVRDLWAGMKDVYVEMARANRAALGQY